MYIESKTPPFEIVDKGEGGAIRVQGDVTNSVNNVLWHKIIRRVKTKKGQNTEVQT